MMQRAFDLPWRTGRRLGGNAQHQRATRRFWSFTGYIFRGYGKKPTATFFGVWQDLKDDPSQGPQGCQRELDGLPLAAELLVELVLGLSVCAGQ